MTQIKRKTIPRDISWLSFNGRVLQEAADPTVPLKQRVKFLGIFSNNTDEFFRVRVATLKRMVDFGPKLKNMHLEQNPAEILTDIQEIVLDQQSEFNRIWDEVRHELEEKKIFLVNEKELNVEKERFVTTFFEQEVRSNILLMMVDGLTQL